ncbi:hypothetical protein BVX98_07225, partial [bacterium F11]
MPNSIGTADQVALKNTTDNVISVKKVYRQSHFAPAFVFLPAERRQALKVLYAVCRILDDAVDKEDRGSPLPFLEAWRNVFEKKEAYFVKEFGYLDLAKQYLFISEQFQIPPFAMIDLIEKGVSVDLEKNRFQTPMETEAYCYG